MKNALGLIVMCVTLLAVSSTGFGYTFDDVVIESWAGPAGVADPENATYKALTVIDFGGGNSFAFGYGWNSPETTNSEEMLTALKNADNGLTVNSSTHQTFGMAVYGFVYTDRLAQDHTILGSPFFDIPQYPANWWSGAPARSEEIWEPNPDTGVWELVDTIDFPAAPADGENWLYASKGVRDRVLVDGYWDGWTQGDGPYGTIPPEPVAPVQAPEPMTMTLLALGSLGLMRTRRRRG